MTGPRTWLCDLDGTLVDSAPVHEAAYRRALAEHAPELLAGFRYAPFAGLSTREAARRLVPDPETATLLALGKQRAYRTLTAAGVVTPFPGAVAFLERLAARGHPAYLVTGGSRASVERVLPACGLDGAFAGILTADDVAVSKPDPGFYREACRRWSLDPRRTAAVEDSPSGVASAVGAGLLTYQVHGSGPIEGAVHVADLDALSALLDGQEAVAHG